MSNRPSEIETKLLNEKAANLSFYVGWQYLIEEGFWIWRGSSSLKWLVFPKGVDQDFLDEVVADPKVDGERRFMAKVMARLDKEGHRDLCVSIVQHLRYAQYEDMGYSRAKLLQMGLDPNPKIDLV